MATASPCACGELAGLLGGAAAEQRDHPAVARLLARLLHQAAAQRDELEPVLLVERLGGDERGELAERVTGHVVAERVADRLPAGEARAEDRRLREVRALIDPRERIGRRASNSTRSSRSGRCSSTVSRISGVWLPCPGNRMAVAVIRITVRTREPADTAPEEASPRSGGRPRPNVARYALRIAS